MVSLDDSQRWTKSSRSLLSHASENRATTMQAKPLTTWSRPYLGLELVRGWSLGTRKPTSPRDWILTIDSLSVTCHNRSAGTDKVLHNIIGHRWSCHGSEYLVICSDFETQSLCIISSCIREIIVLAQRWPWIPSICTPDEKCEIDMKLKEKGLDRVANYSTNTRGRCSSVGAAPTNSRTTIQRPSWSYQPRFLHPVCSVSSGSCPLWHF